MILIKNIFKTYDKKLILNNISFQIEQNKPLGLIGCNGAGKTTTLMILSQLVTSDSGVITLDNKKILKSDIFMVLDGQRNYIWSISVRENYRYFAALRGFNYSQILEKLENEEKFQIIHNLLDIKFGKLSMGQKQIVSILFPLLIDSKILLLDEPSNGLDFENQEILNNLIINNFKNRYVVISSHNIEFIYKTCSEFVIMNKGIINHTLQKTNLKSEYDLKNIYKNSLTKGEN